VVIAGNGDSIYKRLMHAIGRDDLGLDPELATNLGRVKRTAAIDGAIGDWAFRKRRDGRMLAASASALAAAPLALWSVMQPPGCGIRVQLSSPGVSGHPGSRCSASCRRAPASLLVPIEVLPIADTLFVPHTNSLFVC